MRESIPNISLGTVYRNLNQLANAGIILRLPCDGKTDHFDACTDTHYHFMCRDCGAVKDVDMQPIDILIEEARKHSEFTLESASVLFTGLCEECKNK